MTSRTYATLNPNAKDEFLSLSQGNQIVTCNAANLTGSHMILATIPKAVGRAYFEVYFWSVSRGNLAGLASVGVAEPDADLTKYVGEAENSWGFRPFDGGIWNNGAVEIAGNAIGERLCIGTYINFNSTPGPFLSFSVNRNFYGSLFLPTDSSGNPFLVAAISLGCGVNAGDISAFFNAGQRPFDAKPLGTIS